MNHSACRYTKGKKRTGCRGHFYWLGIPGSSSILGAVWEFIYTLNPSGILMESVQIRSNTQNIEFQSPFFQMTSPNDPQTQNMLSENTVLNTHSGPGKGAWCHTAMCITIFCIRCTFPLRIHLPGEFPSFSGIYHETELGIWFSPTSLPVLQVCEMA